MFHSVSVCNAMSNFLDKKSPDEDRAMGGMSIFIIMISRKKRFKVAVYRMHNTQPEHNATKRYYEQELRST